MNTPRAFATSLLSLLLMVGVLAPAFPQKVHAQNVDYPNLVQNTITAVKDSWLVLKESSLDAIAWKVAREAIASISKSTVKWINSGFNGSPAYVTDLQRTLLRVSDKVANDFFRQLTTNQSINSPFRNIIAASLRDQYYRSTGRNSYFNINQYTLNQFSQNPAAFLGGDFSQGGLRAWQAAWGNCQNNPYCASEAAQGELINITGQSQGGTLTELSWGQGIQSYRGNHCAGNAGTIGGSTNAGTGTVTGGTSSTHSGSSTGTSGSTNAGTGTVVSLSNVDNCVGQPIQTPGAAINASLEKVVGTELDQLGLADEFNEVLAALMSQLMKTMLGGGGLAGLSKPSSGGGASFIDQVRGVDPVSGGSSTSSSGAFLQMITNQKEQMAAYIANWMTIKSAASSAIESCSNDGNAPAVVAQADAAIAKADAAVSVLIELEAKMDSATEAAGAEQATILNEVMQGYDVLLTTLPTATEIANAAAQSQSGSGTLYTQMTELADSCGA